MNYCVYFVCNCLKNRINKGLYFESEIKTIAEESEALWRFLDKELVYKLNNCKLREKYQIG